MQMKIFFLGMLLAGANAAALLETRVSQLIKRLNIFNWREVNANLFFQQVSESQRYAKIRNWNSPVSPCFNVETNIYDYLAST